MFIDSVAIEVEGGTGGSGSEAFRRERGRPRGGPAGGDGGDGGDVVLVCDAQLMTLLDFRYHAQYRAGRGGHGEGNDRTGRRGEDRELRVPPGTIVTDAETGEVLGELLDGEERLVVAKGGRGGLGNVRFATATRQAPTHWQPGEEGIARTIELTLKLIADVGLVGEPNAGKSTFLSVVSQARPKIADYPFTTLTPNLGVVELSGYRSFVVADIPGIIEGAHEGRGLGLRFLRHIERTRTLAILVPADDPDPAASYERLRAELASYSPELARRPHCVVMTKADLGGAQGALPIVEAPGAWGRFVVSSVTREGLGALLDALWRRVRTVPGEPGRPDPVVGATRSGASDAPTRGEAARGDEEIWWRSLDEEF